MRFLTPLLSLLSLTTASSHVNDLTRSSFPSTVHAGTPGLVEFYAPWCGHCKTLAPVYEQLATHFAHAKDKVHISRVDADSERKLGDKYGIQGFPTLKWFDGVSEEPVEEYSGKRDLESLVEWVEKKVGVKAKGKKKQVEKSEVVMLDEKRFKEVVGGDKDVLVAFTAPWCGHCKTLAPIYESLAATFSREPGVVIAKVDCEAESSKQLAIEHGIQGFPTIKFFPKGETTPVDYRSARDEESFVEFLNEHAKTHRVVGGGLTEEAGRTEQLDEIAKGKKIDEVIELLKKEEGDDAKVYLKIAEKVKSKGDGYVEKERLRLEKIIKKGGVAGAKVDEMVRKRNVLGVFGERDETEEKEAKDEL